MSHEHDHSQYGLPDIRQLMTGRPQFLPVMSQTSVVESFPVLHHPGLLPTPHHYESLGSGGGVLCSSTANARGGGSSPTVDFDFVRHHEPENNISARGVCGLELEGGFGIGGEAAGNGRWPRQETLTLLEIRSRLDFKFKEANQKGPLWDEVSRIMGEENGYHRSGKKCREKFENLYKYYKKTKEGKAGRQDGKHYRFFRQLEAIYGCSNNNNNLNQQPPNSLPETNLGSYNNNNNSMPLLGSTHDMIKNQETGHHHHFQEHKNMISESLSFTNEYSSTELETSSSENVNNANNNDDNQDLSAIAFMMSGQNNNKSKEKRVGRRSGNSNGNDNSSNWKAKVKEFIDSNMRKLMETQEEWMERMLKAIEVKETERMREEEERRRQEAARLEREQEFWAKERAWLEARDVALMEALKKVSGDSSDNNNLGVFCSIMEERSKKLKEDTRTYNYFQQLDLYNSNNNQDHHRHQQQQQQLRQEEEGNGGINMDSNSNVGILHMNNEEMWWDKFGLKLSNDKYHQG